MKTLYRKRFLKDLASLPSQLRPQIEHFVFEEVPKAGSLQETGKAERMTGYPCCFKASGAVFTFPERDPHRVPQVAQQARGITILVSGSISRKTLSLG